MRFAAILCDLDGVLVDSGDAVEAVWREWAAVQGLDAEALPGAAELLARAPAAGLAVVTSGSWELAAARLESAGLQCPAILVSADAVRRGKPAPDAYLVAAQALGADPSDCVVIEDSPTGVQAGRAARMTVWAVTTTHRADELEEADHTAADLAALLEPLGL